MYALTTLLPDGLPHTTPVIGLWDGEGFLLPTGPHEQKARNLRAEPRASVHIGSTSFSAGADIVLRGGVERVIDTEALAWMRNAFIAKYGEVWTFDVGDGVLINDVGGDCWCFRLAPAVAYSFTRGDRGAHTRYRFAAE